MTDKQIIIDGCDVSKCEFYNKDDKTCREVNGNYDTDICEFDKCENSNCVYKQLKRKEQELKKICKAFDIEYAIDEETGNLFGRCNKLYKKEQKSKKLKQTLAEIKDIAKKRNYLDYNECLDDILQKISKCEVENEN